ncbi:unnamed protein product [Rhizoctonia solani]|uniref:F-box domain-containing protein n=1 Tax=Rhizoctonia solani TaxID=456999 RepID=A0A8H3DF36_9AGAM|nr:unnamed protein product [Rhizoctonia solani]
METRSSACFSDFSDEIIIQMLHFSDYMSIIQFAATSKRHHSIVTDSVSLQLLIELDVHGLSLINGSYNYPKNRTSSVQLDELLRYQDAWLNLRFDEPIERSLHEYSICELREGNYAIAFSSTGSLRTFDSLQIIPLSSLNNPNLTQFQSDFQDFTVDFGQDLVILVSNDPHDINSLEVKLASIKTGHAHPLAQRPAFSIKVGFEISTIGDSSFSFEVMGDILVTQVEGMNEQEFEILAWNWKTCTLLSRIASDFGAASFTFLDTTHLLVCSSGKDEEKHKFHLCRITISLYSISIAATDKHPGCTVFRTSDCPHTHPVLVFEFPELHDFYELSFRGIFRSAPVPGRALSAMKNAITYLKAQTLGLSFTLLPRSGSWTDRGYEKIHLRVFISASHLLRYLKQHSEELNTISITWGEWGTQATRWFLCDRETDFWAFWSSGSRFLRVDDDPRSAFHELSIFDFDPRASMRHEDYKANTQIPLHHSPVREEMKRLTLGGRGLTTPHIKGPTQVQTPRLFVDTIDSSMPTVIERGFTSPVESRLPFRVVSKPQFVPTCVDWFIDESHIIGRNPTQQSREGILVYNLRI